MGVMAAMAGLATSRVHVLAVEVPGWWSTRVEVERDVRARGWSLALSPADADALVVCGRPAEGLREATERVWEQLPGPRARTEVLASAGVAVALDDVLRRLRDTPSQTADARERPAATDMDHGDMDHGHMDHGDMGHGDTEMSPHGIPLASGTADRDGLEMDVLHLPLGPVLPQWPAGMVLRCTLSGDVVTEAAVEVLAGGPVEAASDDLAHQHLGVARRVDAACRVLALAGWDDEATRLRVARDALWHDGATSTAVRALARSSARVRRSRTLAWMLRDLGRVTADRAGGLDLPDCVHGDVHDRLLAMLDGAAAGLGGDGRVAVAPPAALIGLLPSLVTGLDLAAVRLVVASLDVRVDQLAEVEEVVPG